MIKIILASLIISVSQIALAAPIFMSPNWAKKACDAWNADKVLTTKLAGESWMDNNADRGFKVIHFNRDDCKDSKKVELTISKQNGKAMCTYGGAIVNSKLNSDVDYYMHATDDNWLCMGKGDWGCGPMGAMMTGALLFEGPKMEAMGVMGPFENFLLLTGKVESDRKSCP